VEIVFKKYAFKNVRHMSKLSDHESWSGENAFFAGW
jgi:hypothetical protein